MCVLSTKRNGSGQRISRQWLRRLHQRRRHTLWWDKYHNAQVDSSNSWARGCYSRCKSMERDHYDEGLHADWTVGGKSRVPWLEEMFRCCLLAVLSQYIFFSFILTHRSSHRYGAQQHRNSSHNAQTPTQCVTIFNEAEKSDFTLFYFCGQHGFPSRTYFVRIYLLWNSPRNATEARKAILGKSHEHID